MRTRDAAPIDAARRGAADNLPPGLSEIERQATEIRDLSAQTERLSQSMDSLLRLHESEQAQRQALQATLDRLVEQSGLPSSARASEALAEEIRRGVSEDLKPLLHAIIDLLELSMGQVSPGLGLASQAKPAATPIASESGGDTWAGEGNATRPMPADDLPRSLPEILTRPVEELVAKGGARRPAGGDETSATGGKARATIEGSHARAWVPVTSGPVKP